MMLFHNVKKDGISLKAAHLLMMVITLIIAVLLLAETFMTTSSYDKLSDATDNYIAMQQSASQLMEASDYLTEEVQCYTVTGDRLHLDNYFVEADVTARREKAVKKVVELCEDTFAKQQLELAMNSSVELMNDEYYAMRLMLEGLGDSDMPEAVKKTELTSEDKALSGEEKSKKAREIVHGEKYLAVKSKIRHDMQSCLDSLEADVRTLQVDCDREVDGHALRLKIFIIVETLAIAFVLWMTSYLGINPILKGVQRIKEDSALPVIGSYEFRYLAKTYNKMYESFKKSLASLNYEASHDKLTGIYNRAGYEVLRESIDIRTTAVLLIDADKFKQINDSHGHTVGDCVLKKIARTLTRTFRSEDYVCRLGGDEFAVFMLHVTSELRDLIEKKVDAMNDFLCDPTKDSLPPVTLSVGVAFGEDAADVTSMINHADKALYKVKERGRKGCCFYQK